MTVSAISKMSVAGIGRAPRARGSSPPSRPDRCRAFRARRPARERRRSGSTGCRRTSRRRRPAATALPQPGALPACASRWAAASRTCSSLRAATSNGRVFVSKNGARRVRHVLVHRHGGGADAVPLIGQRDESNPNHAIVTYSGSSSTTPGTPGHVYDVVFDPVAGTATWADISYNLGDQPILDSVRLDHRRRYVSTDFGVNRPVSGTTSWIPAADGLPTRHGLRPEAHLREERNANPLRGLARPRRLPAQAAVGTDYVAAAVPRARRQQPLSGAGRRFGRG